MQLAELVPISKVTTQLLAKISPLIGIDSATVLAHGEVIELALEAFRDSGKYKTLGDLINDPQVIEMVEGLVKPTEHNITQIGRAHV